MSTARHHAEWLSLLEITGPFLSMPVLLDAFPQGLDAHESGMTQQVRAAYEEWLDNRDSLRPDPAIHTAWIRYVMTTILEMLPEVMAEGQSIPGSIRAHIAEHNEVIRPDIVISDPEDHLPRLLVQTYPAKQDLERIVQDGRWVASPATRMLELLRATNIKLGLVTNGEQWMLVTRIQPNEPSGYISWYAGLWTEELITLRAFRSLLRVERFFNVPENQTLEALLQRSLTDQQEVTDQLGYQVRRAVEILIQSIDRADKDRQGTLLADVGEDELYSAALFVMMRLVFLLFAEERGLLLRGDPVYDQNYAISTLGAQLRTSADQHGEDVLERRADAWSRLLATFRLVFAGVQHENLRLPAYGGSLFDPDKFPFLEGRSASTSWLTTPADPLPIDNRTVLHLLEALEFLRMKVPGGGIEARRLSFRALDVEQIGHVYEGLLDHKAARATEPVLGLSGSKNQQPEIALSALEDLHTNRGVDALINFLKDETGRTVNALRSRIGVDVEPDLARQLRVVCGSDDLYQRVLPFAHLIRDDDFGWPTVILPDSVYVTRGTTRRATGTHYTPKSLTEPIVQNTLEPLVYTGPAVGLPREQWTLKSPAELLDLKICDMAMGSGGFLVQACRFLAERLVEAWDALSPDGQPGMQVTPYGEVSEGMWDERFIPQDEDEQLLLARRLIAERCLYGVDKNPLAVEMGKLSLWLITLDSRRPFTFLDHALKCGDSLVGVSMEQLRLWNLDTSTQTHALLNYNIRALIDDVTALRRHIMKKSANDIRDQQEKARLLTEAEQKAHTIKSAADHLVWSYFTGLPSRSQTRLRADLLAMLNEGVDLPDDWRKLPWLPSDLLPFHWELEFPEVYVDGRGGFDAFIGNPPFMGGKKIGFFQNPSYSEFLRGVWSHAKGSPDICAYFFLQAYFNLRSSGCLGLVATNTIAQGGTREVGLNHILEHQGVIFRAINSQPWPGLAAVVVSIVHICKEKELATVLLDGREVQHISSRLDEARDQGAAFKLTANEGRCFIGSYVLGTGFIIEHETAQRLIEQNAKNTDVIFPYLGGDDVNSQPDVRAGRSIINFFDWSFEQASQYPDCLEILTEHVKPQRDEIVARGRQIHEYSYWKYWDKRLDSYALISTKERVLVQTLHTKYLAPVFVLPQQVFSHALAVFVLDDDGSFAILQSSIHEAWVRERSGSLGTTLRYTPTGCFETFPFPIFHDSVDSLGKTYYQTRRDIMFTRWEGLTSTYNRFNDPEEAADDITGLRELHAEMDCAICAAYGWNDLNLGHGFHQTPQGIRYTISEPARREVLTRLLRLNHERHEEELRQQSEEPNGKSNGDESAPAPEGFDALLPPSPDPGPRQLSMLPEEEETPRARQMWLGESVDEEEE